MDKPVVIALCGPAASGKDTLAKELYLYMRMNSLFCNLIVSDTTRPMRSGEEEGIDYFFKTINEFVDKYRDKQYIETTRYRDWYYGTDKSQIVPNHINIGVFNLDGLLSLKGSDKYNVIPVYLKIPFVTRMQRYAARAGKVTFEQFRRAFVDTLDFLNIDLYLDNLFAHRYLVLKSSNILENCKAIIQHLASLGLENH